MTSTRLIQARWPWEQDQHRIVSTTIISYFLNMTTLEDLDLKNLKMTGPVSVEECTERLAGAGPLIVILYVNSLTFRPHLANLSQFDNTRIRLSTCRIMGPTGAGKSSVCLGSIKVHKTDSSIASIVY